MHGKREALSNILWGSYSIQIWNNRKSTSNTRKTIYRNHQLHRPEMAYDIQWVEFSDTVASNGTNDVVGHIALLTQQDDSRH